MNKLKEALVNYVLGARTKDGIEDGLQPYLAIMAKGNEQKLRQIITDLGTSAAKTEQTPNLLDNIDDFIKRIPTKDDAAYNTLSSFAQSNASFDTWADMIRRTMSGVQGRLGERGVSLYHEFKVLSAISHATNGDARLLEQGFTLASGDFPGVQQFIYAIPSDGATKKVRGRSFFLQLLADCVVRRILHEFQLPTTNALYTAGGKFLLLLPANSETQLNTLYQAINERLLKQFDGDLRLILASTTMPANAIANAQAYKESHQRLAEQIRKQKLQPFRDVLLGKMESSFLLSQEDDLSDFIADADDERKDDPYAQLAQVLANTQNNEPHLLFSVDNSISELVQGDDYRNLFAYLTGIRCEIITAKQIPKNTNVTIVKLNNPRFEGADGFRLLAARTPLVMDIDLQYWKKTLSKRQNSKREDDREPQVDRDIRTFEFMAVQGNSDSKLTRYGLLRMDVDNLGKIFVGTTDGNVNSLEDATLTRYLALSDSMSLFFEGYVPILCQNLEEQEQRPNSLYLIYGGGDDLFIVGEWDLLPRLAQMIRDELHTYTNGQLSISAGLMLFSQKYPFYRAAYETGEVLDEKAKAHGRNAICFLNTVVRWGDEWEFVSEQSQKLLRLSEFTKSSITQNVLEIYRQWLEESGDAQDRNIHFGPFKWRAAYRMTKLAMQYGKQDASLSEDIRAIQRDLLNVKTMRLSGISARWAELQLRLHKDRDD